MKRRPTEIVRRLRYYAIFNSFDWTDAHGQPVICGRTFARFFVIPKKAKVIWVHASTRPVQGAYRMVFRRGLYRRDFFWLARPKPRRGLYLEVHKYLAELTEPEDLELTAWIWVEYEVDAPELKGKAK